MHIVHNLVVIDARPRLAPSLITHSSLIEIGLLHLGLLLPPPPGHRKRLETTGAGQPNLVSTSAERLEGSSVEISWLSLLMLEHSCIYVSLGESGQGLEISVGMDFADGGSTGRGHCHW
jgi:hypothetical protein